MGNSVAAAGPVIRRAYFNARAAVFLLSASAQPSGCNGQPGAIFVSAVMYGHHPQKIGWPHVGQIIKINRLAEVIFL